MKGLALTDEGKTEDAMAIFRAVIADYPELPEPRNNLAVLYAQKGEYAQARDELERAIQTAPDYAVAHENLGDVYARLAEVEYEKTIALDKRNRTAEPKLKLIRETSSPKK
jgi:tetratricopeptide (TPR) repeat protein